jgi:glycosyltransferase involved in cell wall biosynthesis
MVLVEAMAAGLPIVTTDAPGVRDVIDDGENGLKVPVGNPRAVADMVCFLVKNSELSRKLSDNSIRQAKDSYDWETVTGKYIALYDKILKGHF